MRDRIVAFGGVPASQIGDLSQHVLVQPQQTTVTVERDGQSESTELALTLRGNPVRLGISWKTDDAEPGVVIITTVVPSSPADRAGIAPLDRLLPPDSVDSAEEDWPKRLAIQKSLMLRREREGKIDTLTITTLRPQPPK